MLMINCNCCQNGIKIGNKLEILKCQDRKMLVPANFYCLKHKWYAHRVLNRRGKNLKYFGATSSPSSNNDNILKDFMKPGDGWYIPPKNINYGIILCKMGKHEFDVVDIIENGKKVTVKWSCTRCSASKITKFEELKGGERVQKRDKNRWSRLSRKINIKNK